MFSLQRGLFSEHPEGASRWRGALLGAAASIAALAACDGGTADESSVATVQGPLAVEQGMTLQGMTLQGMTLQGMTLQGMTLQGTTLQGTTLQGTTLQGSAAPVSAPRQISFSGGKLIGVAAGDVISSTAADGTKIVIRVDGTQVDPGDPSGDITLYALSLQSEQTREWSNPCQPDPWGQQWAIPVGGSWDATGAHVDTPGTFSFACTSGVIAKCVRWGYKPWASHGGVSLAPYHQACTRMARADYCGDGTSRTLNGTLIDVYDTLGVQTRTSGADFLFEGAWTPAGAYCVSKERWFGLTPQGKQSEGPPLDLTCTRDLQKLSLLSLPENDECAVKLRPELAQQVLIFNRSRANVAPGSR